MPLQVTFSKTVIRVLKGQHGTIKFTPLGPWRYEVSAPRVMEIEKRPRIKSTSSGRRKRRNRIRK